MNSPPQRRFSSAAHQFVKQTLIKHPGVRPSADQLLHHQFIKQTRKFHTSLKHILQPILPITHETTSGQLYLFFFRKID